VAARAATPVAEKRSGDAAVGVPGAAGRRARGAERAARLRAHAGEGDLRHIRIHDLRHTFASLLLQQGESVVYVKEQLGHSSIQITVDTYGHLIPGANRGAVNRLDDNDATQPAATQAQPQAYVEDPDVAEVDDLLGESGEPRWNRTLLGVSFEIVDGARLLALRACFTAAYGKVPMLSSAPGSSRIPPGLGDILETRGVLNP
jgi:hypothetical protein